MTRFAYPWQGLARRRSARISFTAYTVSSGRELRRHLVPLVRDRGLVYVDCGARGGRLPRGFRLLRNTQYVGFDADEAECARLNSQARPNHRFIAAVLAAEPATRQFYVTRSAACSSLLEPNRAFLADFVDLPELFRVESHREVQSITLDECLVAHGIEDADFLELDTQGSELDVLRGASGMLRHSILGVQVEVEFAPLYVGQPLFADVDAFLRALGFRLFDLSRYYGRRRSLSTSTPTRGQLLWGHAVYLRDPAGLDDTRATRLAVIAVLLDLPDVAAGIMDAVIVSTESQSLRSALERARGALTIQGEASWLARRLRPLMARVRRQPWSSSLGRATWRN